MPNRSPDIPFPQYPRRVSDHLSLFTTSHQQRPEAKREKAAKKRDRVAAKKEKAASKRAKVSTGKLPDDVKAIKAELNALAARQATTCSRSLKRLSKAVPRRRLPRRRRRRRRIPKTRRRRTRRRQTRRKRRLLRRKTPRMRRRQARRRSPRPSPAVATSAPTAPTDEELEYAVKEMLAGVNLESVSMKKIRVDLEEKFGVPLNDKKSIIKEFAEKYIS